MNINLTYQIRVRGHIPEAWKDAFTDLELSLDQDACGAITVLSGTFMDAAALQGLLNNLYMLGMALISVICLNACQLVSNEESHDAIQ